jgi:hypothetical protein
MLNRLGTHHHNHPCPSTVTVPSEAMNCYSKKGHAGLRENTGLCLRTMYVAPTDGANITNTGIPAGGPRPSTVCDAVVVGHKQSFIYIFIYFREVSSLCLGKAFTTRDNKVVTSHFFAVHDTKLLCQTIKR